TLDKLLNLTPVTYNWKSENNTDPIHTGFIAQEVEQIFPNLVSIDPNTGLKSLNMIGMTPYMVKAIQELDLEIKDLVNVETLLIDAENNKTFAGLFFGRIITWLGDVANGIQDFYANRVRTKEICISDDSGETCINKTQLDNLLNSNGSASSQSGSNPPPIDEVAPTCSDGIQNQDETGIDTGGVCAPADNLNSSGDSNLNGDQNTNQTPETGGDLKSGEQTPKN
ncbi:MAG: tail fiber domain-containing protein, partial [archaeon]